MKKGLMASYMTGIRERASGESYESLVRYFLPEVAVALILYLPPWIDAYFIGHLRSTPTYAILGYTHVLLHMIIKMAEGFSVGTTVLSGQFNGLGESKAVGRSLRDAFWVTIFMGVLIAAALFFGASSIYKLYGVSAEMAALGVPYLRLRALGVFFTFVCFAFIGFLRGIKDTKTPMYIFLTGLAAFAFFDYALIFGRFGFPEMGLQGSALAGVMQYLVMLTAAFYFIFASENRKRYAISLFSVRQGKSQWRQLLKLSFPVALDKATFAMAYIWLGSLLTKMGTCASATFCMVKDMERFAVLPALAFAQVITFLVSNDYINQNWYAIKTNIKKVIFLSSTMVITILVFCSMYPEHIIGIFDKKGEFTALAARIFPVLSILVFSDVLQVLLSGALRGAANVKVVMYTRLAVCTFFFLPVSWFISQAAIQDDAMKIVLIYASFYFGNALMTLVYINRFRGEEWKSLGQRKG